MKFISGLYTPFYTAKMNVRLKTEGQFFQVGPSWRKIFSQEMFLIQKETRIVITDIL